MDERSAYGSLGREVGDGDEVTTVSVDECLVPRPSILVADLEDVSESRTTILLREIFDSGSREVVGIELAAQLLLSGGNGNLNLDRRSSRSGLL